MMIRAVLFDFMDTLVKDHFYDSIKIFFGNSLKTYLSYKNQEAYIAFEKAQISAQEYLDNWFISEEKAKEASFNPLDFKAFLLQPSYIFPPVQKLLENILEYNKSKSHLSKLQVCLASNYTQWIHTHLDYLDMYYIFDYFFISYQMNARKPEKEFYQKALVTLNLSPQECLFVDNNGKNIDAANKLGFYTCLATPFENGQDWTEEVSRILFS